MVHENWVNFCRPCRCNYVTRGKSCCSASLEQPFRWLAAVPLGPTVVPERLVCFLFSLSETIVYGTRWIAFSRKCSKDGPFLAPLFPSHGAPCLEHCLPPHDYINYNLIWGRSNKSQMSRSIHPGVDNGGWKNKRSQIIYCFLISLKGIPSSDRSPCRDYGH